MKKMKVLLLILLFIFLPSCGSKNEHSDDDNKVQVKSVDMKAASSVMSNYMTDVILGNTAGMRSFYTAKYRSSMEEVPKAPEPHPVGYKIENGETKENNVEFKVHVFNSYSGKPYYSEDVFSYAMKNEDDKILIDSVKRESSMELYEKDKKIYKRTIQKSDEKASEEEIISLDDLPEYVNSEGVSLPEQKFQVPRTAFGPCAFSSKGETMAVTSKEKNTFLCLIKPKEDSETNAKSDGGGEGGGGEEGGDKKQDKEKETKPKKAQVTITPVDFYFDADAKNIIFSEDGKTLVAEYVKSGMSKIAAYEEGKKEINLKLDETFKPDRFSISSPFFTEDGKIQFKVQAVSNATDEEKKMNGYWNVDIKTNKINKVTL